METITSDQQLNEAGFYWRELNGLRALVCLPLEQDGFVNGFSTRMGGVSSMPSDSLSLAGFHDDDADAVEVVRPGRYRSTATIPADLLAPHDYLLILRGTIHGVRPLTGDGVAIPITVTGTSRINRAYPHEPVRAKLQPFIAWRTEEI